MNKLLVVVVAVAPYLTGCAAVLAQNPQNEWTTTDGSGDTIAAVDTSGDDDSILDTGGYYAPWDHREHEEQGHAVAQHKTESAQVEKHEPAPSHEGTHTR